MKHLSMLGLFLLTKVYGYAPVSNHETPYYFEHHINIGGCYSYSKTTFNNVSFKGSLFGVQGNFIYQPCKHLYLELNKSYKKGSIYHSPEKYLVISHHNIHQKLGYFVAWNSSKGYHTTMLLFSGFGCMSVQEHLKQQDLSSIGLKYTHFYIPLGLNSSYHFNHNRSIGLNIMWNPQIYPLIEIVNFYGLKWQPHTYLNNWLLEIPITFNTKATTDKKRAFVLKPFIEYWHSHSLDVVSSKPLFSQSNLKVTLPSSTNFFYGATVDISFAF